MAEWDFESALKDYFGGGGNRYNAPSAMDGPPEYMPPGGDGRGSDSSDIERWWQSPEGREMFRAPFATGGFVDVYPYAPHARELQERRQENEVRGANPVVLPRSTSQDIFSRWLSAANEWARQNVPVVGGAEDLAGNVRRYAPYLPLFLPRESPEETVFDPTEDLRANYPGIQEWAYPLLARIPTRVRRPEFMPPPYGEEGTHATGFALPPPFGRITLAGEPGKRPSPSDQLHEAAHAMSYHPFGFMPTWEGPDLHLTGPGWRPFANAVLSYRGNPSEQFAAVNADLLNRQSYLRRVNPMEAYAEIARLSEANLFKMPPEFRQFYPWLNYYYAPDIREFRAPHGEYRLR